MQSCCMECAGDLPTGQHIEQAVLTIIDGEKGYLCPDCAKWLNAKPIKE